MPAASSRRILRRFAFVSLLGAAALAGGCAEIAGFQNSSSTSDTRGGEVEISPTTLDFGGFACGAASATRKFSIVNRARGPVGYKVTVYDPEALQLNIPLEGQLTGGQVLDADVTLTPKTGGPVEQELLVTAETTPLTTSRITVKGTAEGTVLLAAPTVLSLGEVPMTMGGLGQVAIHNMGSTLAVITDFDREESDQFTIEWTGKPAPISLAPGEQELVTLRLVAGTASEELTTTFRPRVDGACDVAPVVVRGRRVDSNVTVGAVDWGGVACGSRPDARSVVISNYSLTQLSYEATLPGSSRFQILGTDSAGSVPAAAGGAPGTRAVTVNVPTDVPGTFEDEMTVTFKEAGAPPPRTASIRAKVNGAQLVVTAPSPPSLTFTSNGTTEDEKTFTVRNTGNATATLTWTVPMNSGFTVSETPVPVLAGAQTTAAVTFKHAGKRTANLGMFALPLLSGPICGATPSVALQGN